MSSIPTTDYNKFCCQMRMKSCRINLISLPYAHETACYWKTCQMSCLYNILVSPDQRLSVLSTVKHVYCGIIILIVSSRSNP